MTEKILFISSFIGHNKSGGSVAAARNLEICRQLIPSIQVDAYGFSFRETPVVNNVTWLPSHKSPIETFINYFFGNAGSVSFSNFRKIMAVYRKGGYPVVFLDSSLLGKLARQIRRRNKNAIIICFFHNVEKHFFLSKLIKNFLWLPLFFAAVYNERQSAKYADFILCFNNRDAAGIKKNYGKNVSATIPVTVIDCLKRDLIKIYNTADNNNPPRLLFIGSDFYANTAGLRWFIQRVMPFTKATLTVAGKGMEKYRQELESGQVEILGTVDDISNLYYDADIVIAPIFTGSGMKIKTAEALMMGKTLVATREAWEGYVEPEEAGGVECNSADDFIAAINFYAGKSCLYNEKARAAFEKYYSQNSLHTVVNRLANDIKGALQKNA